MDGYNQTISTTTNFDSLGIEQSYSVRVITYNYFDFFALILFPLIFIWLVFLFRRRRR